MNTQRLNFAGMDLDTEAHLLPAGSYQAAWNLRLYNPLTQASGTAEALPGHQLLAAAMPDTGVNQVIGGCDAPALESVIFFVCNSLGRHTIGQLNYRTLVATALLEWEGLNLSPGFRISSSLVVEKTLFWTDFRSEPRKLNLGALLADAALYGRLKASDPHYLDLLRRGPQFPLEVSTELTSGRASLLPRTALQFSYNYLYRNGETSVIAPWSALLLAPDPRAAMPYNVIRLRLPLPEVASELVARVEVLLRTGSTGAVQRLASVPLFALGPNREYRYYGDVAAASVDPAYAIKPFDYVPRRARAVAYTTNRLFLGGNVEGFDRPTVALTAVTQAQEQETLLTNQTVYHQFFDECHGVPRTDSEDLDIVCTTANDGGYFFLRTGIHADPAATYVQLATATDPFGNVTAHGTFMPASLVLRYDQLVRLTGQGNTLDYYSSALVPASGWEVVNLSATTLTGAVRKFKSGSTYKVGVQFYDWAGRHPGVALGTTLVSTPDAAFDTTGSALATQIRWTLDRATQTAQIPAWASSYQLLRTRNLRYAAFLQFQSADMLYGYRTAAVTETDFLSRTIVPGVTTHVFLDLSNLAGAEQGYNYTPGDMCRVFVPDNAGGFEIHTVETFGMSGRYLKLSLFNFNGTSSGPQPRRYELYAPYQVSDTEPFYEVGPRYPLTDAGTSARAYSAITGLLEGDVFQVSTIAAKLVSNYNPPTTLSGPETGHAIDPLNTSTLTVESTTPYFLLRNAGQEWTQDLGRISAELREMKQEDKFAAVRFSNTFVQGAANNGISAFEPLNEELMPRESGAIRHLQTVRANLLIIQELSAQAAYIGATQLQDLQGKNLISISDRVMGSHRPLDGGYGCQHPETVRAYNGYVYWWDCRRGVVVRYANDGLTEISGYGLVGYFGNRRRSQLSAEPRPAAWYDPLHKEYVIAPSDEGAVAFCEALNRWTSFYHAHPDYSIIAGGTVISFLGSHAYLHDQEPGAAAHLLGTQRPVSVTVQANAAPGQVKLFETLVLEGSAGWGVELALTPEGQRSHLDAALDFDTEEGKHYAAFLRDELTPNLAAPLIEGDALRSTRLGLTLTHRLGVDALPDPLPHAIVALRAASVGFVLS